MISDNSKTKYGRYSALALFVAVSIVIPAGNALAGSAGMANFSLAKPVDEGRVTLVAKRKLTKREFTNLERKIKSGTRKIKSDAKKLKSIRVKLEAALKKFN